MMGCDMITQLRLKELFHYSETTGLFTRIKQVTRRKVGEIAGTPHKRGYIHIGVDRKYYKAHRLAWLYVYGHFPELNIDHINRDCSDNRICNLRLATQKQNCENISPRKDNTSGYRGVHWHEAAKKWRASISHNKKRMIVGMFDSKEEAGLAARLKREELFTHVEKT